MRRNPTLANGSGVPRTMGLHFALFLLLALPLTAQQDEAAAAIERAKIQAHVQYLASDALEGRNIGYPGNDTAAQYIKNHFSTLGLTPAGDSGTFLQNFSFTYDPAEYRDHDRTTPETVSGDNVLGYLPGTTSEIVVLTAHFDHAGKVGQRNPGRVPNRRTPDDEIYNGADDNASGAALLMEIARVLATEKYGLRRSILFASFNAEEYGDLGAKYYVDHPYGSLSNHVAVFNVDMIGRNPDGPVTVGGIRSASVWMGLLATALVKEPQYVWPEYYGMSMSDHVVFGRKGIPFLYFCSGHHENYHLVTDSADRVSYPAIAERARLVIRMLVATAQLPTKPVWVDPGTLQELFGVEGRNATTTEAGLVGGRSDRGAVRVIAVLPDSVASKAGLRARDLIIRFNSRYFNPGEAFEQLVEEIDAVPLNRSIPVEVLRNGSTITLQATFLP